MTRNEFLKQIGEMSREQLLLVADELHERYTALEKRRHESVAIVGIGCRFPGGADTPESFWKSLWEGRNAVAELPPQRRRGGLAGTRPLRGAFFDDVDGFDCGFFGITPKEAQSIDPQQRLFLELAWEAAESAGVTRERLVGSRSSVFAALCETYYSALQFAPGAKLDAYSGVGASPAALAGRLSYLLDLQGPSFAVDTACSSSLVALHLAVGSLRSGESDLAFVGGVNVISSHACLIPFEHMGVWSTGGACRTFDTGADGFVAGEGGGVLILRRLSDAMAEHEPIFAVIRGTAVNHTGRSPGLTAPSGPAQEAVIRAALDDAGMDAEEIGYIEAHGTATRLGDPVEVEALAAALGPRRSGVRMLGSVKTNLGHLGGAAGIVGLIKAVLAVRHGAIPPHLHLAHINPELSLEAGSFTIPTQPTEWPELPRAAGVSSFGWAGTNAHVVIAAASEDQTHSTVQVPEPLLLPLSARSESALRAMAVKWNSWLRAEASGSADIAYTASCRRTHHPFRLAVLGDTRVAWADALDAWSRGEPVLQNEMATRYIAGESIDWNDLYRDGRIVTLPTYPWQRDQFDLPVAKPLRGAPVVAPDLEQWLKEVVWEEKPLVTPTKRQPRSGVWWIVGRREGIAGALAAELARLGHRSIAATEDEIDFQSVREPWAGIVFVRALDLCSSDPFSEQRTTCGALLKIVQATLRTGWSNMPQMVIVMRPTRVAHAPLRGFGLSLAREHPELRCTMIDLEDDAVGALAVEILGQPECPEGEGQVRLANGHRFVARLHKVSPAALGSNALRIDPNGTYLITGGLGALGLRVAKRLAERGAGRLLLIGRHAPTRDASRIVESLQSQTQVVVCHADVADFYQLSAALAADLPSIRGVVHAAGTLDDGFVMQLDWRRFEVVLAPKILGAWNLHRLFGPHNLDFFVLFSSAAGLVGSPGQANYTAANAFLDALAVERRRNGLTALSIQWGPWAESGMAAAHPYLGERLAARGIASIPLEDGMAILERILASDLTSVAVVDLPAERATPVLDLLSNSAAPDRKKLLRDHVRNIVAAVSGLAPALITPDAALSELGVDSIMAVDIQCRLSDSLGVELPASLLWFHPTPESLVTKLASLTETAPAGSVDDLAESLRIEIAAVDEWRQR